MTFDYSASIHAAHIHLSTLLGAVSLLEREHDDALKDRNDALALIAEIAQEHDELLIELDRLCRSVSNAMPEPPDAYYRALGLVHRLRPRAQSDTALLPAQTITSTDPALTPAIAAAIQPQIVEADHG